jgi:acetyl-CoA C-acetyltransferase
MEAVFERLFQANNIGMSDIDYNEIYSCFPSVTKIAKRIIQPAATQDLSVTGGMTFCRGQLSNFMSQALITMVTKLRLEGRYGLLYGNGHYLTHAAGIIISKERPAPDLLPINLNVQPAANAKMSEIPELVDHHQGSAQIETYTVVFDKENNPAYAIIIARNNLKQRFLAITNKYQESEILPFLDTSIDPIGRQGQSTVRDGYNMWTW